MKNTLRATTTALACALSLGLLAACGDEPAATPEPTPRVVSPSASPSASPSESPSPASRPTEGAGVVIDVIVRGDDLTPNGDRVQAKAGEEITINIDANRAGELHVHSTPEQSFPFEAGRSTLKVTIETPGIVEVEEHEADKVLVVLQVNP